jgi:hypothetical protein
MSFLSDQGERLDPTEVDSNVVLIWGGPYLGLAAGELAPGRLMAFERAIVRVCTMLRRRSSSQVPAPPQCPSSAVSRYWIKVGPANGLPRKQIAPAFSARARTLSSGKAVMKMNGAR